MVVRTESPEINKVRRVAAELLIINHRPDCLVCEKNNRCELQRVAAYVGIDAERLARLRRTERTLPVDSSNPFFTYDPNQCVLCGICVRTCDEIVGLGALDFAHRGFHTMVATFGNKPLVESICESCGECVVRCPWGRCCRRSSSSRRGKRKRFAPIAAVGCGMILGVRDNRIVSVRGDTDSPVNRGRLCVKGRFGYDFVNHPDRLTTPLIRDPAGGSRFPGFREASWDEALGLTAQSLLSIRDRYGPARAHGHFLQSRHQ